MLALQVLPIKYKIKIPAVATPTSAMFHPMEPTVLIGKRASTFEPQQVIDFGCKLHVRTVQ